MTNIQTLNKIAACGLAQFPAGYNCGDAVEAPAAILVRSASLHETPLDPATLAIARAGAGVNNIPIEACTAQGVCVFNTPGANANAVKELVVAGLFLASRKIDAAMVWCRGLKGEGENVGKLVEKGKSAFTGPEILGKTLGVIGLGAIGRLVANAAAELGMRVIGVDPYLTETGKAELCAGITVLEDAAALIAKSDYISLHLPLAKETKGYINAQSLAAAKEGLRLLNFSRAELVDSASLLAALESGRVAAYVTDFPRDELIGVPGVTAIPHLGASTPESEDNCAVMAVRQLTAYLERGEIKNSVNLPSTELPASFQTRVTVIHKAEEGLPEAILSALKQTPVAFVTKATQGVAYTVADTAGAVDAPAIAALEGVLRVRVI
ncbi:MAG: 3-phosphoglycerate dehydrogenase [Oscillospiraceae bacterium]|jgi:D-3-phosphoglycerate dehydrogenase|nr:3-phosphoglycerate dehydrogenase [Oscillospiraceae bacterium]